MYVLKRKFEKESIWFDHQTVIVLPFNFLPRFVKRGLCRACHAEESQAEESGLDVEPQNLGFGIFALSTAAQNLVCCSHVHSSRHSGTPLQHLCFPWTWTHVD